MTARSREVSADPFAEERAAIDRALAEVAREYLASHAPALAQPIEYAMLGGGKRLRAILFLESFRATGGRGDAALVATAIEIVHAYLLVHDDLPCMDDDDMRRGRPTTHKVFGVRAATAAGLAMVPLAARVAFDGAHRLGLSGAVAGEIVRVLMRASGAEGMVGGQLLDLHAEREALPLDRLEDVHARKTGALIAAAARLGGIAAMAPARTIDVLDAFGRALGLAFQIADDVLDVTATTAQLGKTTGKDAALGKSTYPALLGVERARSRANELAERACARLRDAGVRSAQLDAVARLVVGRTS